MYAVEDYRLPLAIKDIVIIASGPSLDYCFDDLQMLVDSGALLLLCDSIAVPIIKRHPQCNRIIFSVEQRRHNYLQALSAEVLFMYTKALKNLSRKNINAVYQFHFENDEYQKIENSTRLKSPGTVFGVALYYVLWLVKKLAKIKRIFLLGADFSYPDNRIYTRAIAYSPKFTRVHSREGHELMAVYRKSAHLWLKEGQQIRTSNELVETKKNIETMLKNFENQVGIYDFSPLGINADSVEKRIPIGANI